MVRTDASPETLPLPINPAARRLQSIDVLRGLLMLLMAVDHSRDYFTAATGFDETDPLRSWPALFATRWITHLCAPGFLALAGASVYLQRRRGKSAGRMAMLLATRGLWLVILETTVISFAWSFSFAPLLQVIWAIGISMLFLATLQWLPVAAVGGLGAAIVLLHNLLDGVQVHGEGVTDGWELLHQEGPLLLHHHMIGFLAYPILPWIGVICLGYAFGLVASMEAAHRRRLAALLGAIFLAVFAILRVAHSYGDHFRFQHLPTASETAMSFLQVEKYPPSLQYLLATFGVLLLLYALLDLAVSRNWLERVRGFVEVFGRVPFFYYVLHIYLLHGAALLLSAAQGRNWHFWLKPYAVFFDHLPGWGYGLPGVYLAWALLVLVLYLPCRWFAGIKAQRRDWWLSYL